MPFQGVVPEGEIRNPPPGILWLLSHSRESNMFFGANEKYHLLQKTVTGNVPAMGFDSIIFTVPAVSHHASAIG